MVSSGNISAKKYILVMMFNMGAWFNVGTVLVELPLLVQYLPESWKLPSIVLMTDLATHVGLLAYVIWRNKHGPSDSECWLVYVILVVGAIASCVEAFVWDITTVVNGSETSVAFLAVLVFIMLSNNMSSVVLLPYMSRLPGAYLSAYFVGEGLAMLIPSLLAMLQGVGEIECLNSTMASAKDSDLTELYMNGTKTPHQDLRFSVQTFFLMACGVTLASTVSFTLLHFDSLLPCCREQTEAATELIQAGEDTELADDKDSSSHNETASLEKKTENPNTITQCEFACFLTALLLSFALWNGIGVGILPYSTIPYSRLTYSLAFCLAIAGNSITSFLLLIVYSSSRKALALLYAIGSLGVTYVIILGAVSPNLPLKHSPFGDVLVVGILQMNDI